MKRFDTFGEYMFDLLLGPLKRGRRAVNQFSIFFRVMGREFDDLKAAIFRVRSEANVISCSEVMLSVHGQDRGMPRFEDEDAEAYRTRLSMKGIVSQWGGTRQGILYALTTLGYPNSKVTCVSLKDPERWAEFEVLIKPEKKEVIRDISIIYSEVQKIKEASSRLSKIIVSTDMGALSIYTGFALSTGRKITVACEIPASLDVTYMTDENGNLLLDEKNDRLIDGED